MNHTDIPIAKQNALKRILGGVIAEINHNRVITAKHVEHGVFDNARKEGQDSETAIYLLDCAFRCEPDEGICFLIAQLHEELPGYVGRDKCVDAMLEFFEGMLALRRMLREMDTTIC